MFGYLGLSRYMRGIIKERDAYKETLEGIVSCVSNPRTNYMQGSTYSYGVADTVLKEYKEVAEG